MKWLSWLALWSGPPVWAFTEPREGIETRDPICSGLHVLGGSSSHGCMGARPVCTEEQMFHRQWPGQRGSAVENSVLSVPNPRQMLAWFANRLGQIPVSLLSTPKGGSFKVSAWLRISKKLSPRFLLGTRRSAFLCTCVFVFPHVCGFAAHRSAFQVFELKNAENWFCGNSSA